MSGVSAGHQTRAHYRWEDNGFAASPNDEENKTFGADLRVTSAEGSNEVRRLFQPGNRQAADLLELAFEGVWAVRFIPSNWWWLRAILGEPSSSGNTEGDGGQIHTYENGEPDSIAINIDHEQGTNRRILKGCVAQQVSIECQVGEPVTVTIRGAYADESTPENPTLASQPAATHDKFTFAQATVNAGGSAEQYVQSWSVEIENQVDLIREMGSRVAIDFNPKRLNPTVSFGELYDGDTTNIARLFGAEDATSVQQSVGELSTSVVLDNGLSGGDGISKTTLTLTSSMPESHSEDGIGDPTADLQEQLSNPGTKITADWVNEVESAI